MPEPHRAAAPLDAIDALRTTVFGAGEPLRIDRVPDGSVSLLVRAGIADDASIVVLGPLTRARYKRTSRVPFTIRAVLSPLAARHVLGVPLDLLADRVMPLGQLWGTPGRDLAGRIAEASPAAAARLLADAVAARHAAPSALDRRIDRARAWLRDGRDVSSIARELGVHERTFRRAFTEHVGMSPKRFARIARLQRVLDHARHGADWARLALDLGYFDQPHLVNDFRDLMGITPAAYRLARSERSTIDAQPRSRRGP